MGLDRPYLVRAMLDMRRWTTYLRNLPPRSADELRDDLTHQLALLHALQISIHLVLDAGAHLLADQQTRPIEEYAQIGPALARAGIIPEGLGARISAMARFRNLLVHRYHDLDLQLVLSSMAAGLEDFEAFVEALLGYLDALPER